MSPGEATATEDNTSMTESDVSDLFALRLKGRISSAAAGNPRIAGMRTTWELLLLPGFDLGSIRRDLGKKPSFAQLTVALRAAQKELRDAPAPRRRIRA